MSKAKRNLQPYKQLQHLPSPIEQQFYRSKLNFITILISLGILICVTVSVYHTAIYLTKEEVSGNES